MPDALTIVFWNTNRQDRAELVAQLAADSEADVVILAEYPGSVETPLHLVRQRLHASFMQPISETPRVQLIAKEHLDLREVYGDASGRVSIRLLRYMELEFLLGVAHLVSKVHWKREDQTTEATILAQQIRDVEVRRGHARTIVIGDLNMNPFEDGVVQASGFHAMMTRATTQLRSRIVQGQTYPFFYNPMWRFFGDRAGSPSGTHYYRHTGHLSYEWNIFDQILIRPDVLPLFRDEVEIVTRIGETELADAEGRPNPEVGSDHFPIRFRLRSQL